MYKIDKLVCTDTYTSYPFLHVKYICVIGIAPSVSSKHHCSVVVYFGEGVAGQWRWPISGRHLLCPHSCRNSDRTEMCESEWTTGPCGRLHKYYSIYGYGHVWVWSYHAPDSHTVVHVNDWNANYISTGEGASKQTTLIHINRVNMHQLAAVFSQHCATALTVMVQPECWL